MKVPLLFKVNDPTEPDIIKEDKLLQVKKVWSKVNIGTEPDIVKEDKFKQLPKKSPEKVIVSVVNIAANVKDFKFVQPIKIP